jgi:hypothetical protein
VRYVLLALALVLIGGAAFLALWEVPPPTAAQEVVIANERFER